MKMLNLFNRKSKSTYEASVRSPVDKHLEKELKEFYTAASKGNLTKLRKLAAKKDITQLNKLTSDALHVACARGHVDVVQFLIERKAKLNQCDSENRSALMKAVQSQHEQCVGMLLENHAEPNLVDNKGNTALHLAANIPSVPIASLLLHHKANINAQNKKGFTPLIVAVREHYIKMANYLLNKRADVNVIDQEQRSPLMIAAGRGQIDILELLMRFNANTALKDTKGWTACEYAVKNGKVIKQRAARKPLSKYDRDNVQKTELGLADVDSLSKNTEKTVANQAGLIHQAQQPSATKSFNMASVQVHLPLSLRDNGNKQEGQMKDSSEDQMALAVVSKHDRDNDQKTDLGLGVLDELSEWDSPSVTRHDSNGDIKQMETEKQLGILSKQDRVNGQKTDLATKSPIGASAYDQKTELGLSPEDELSDWDSPSVTSHDGKDDTDRDNGQITDVDLGLYNLLQSVATKSSINASAQSQLPLQLRHNGNKQEGQSGKYLKMAEIANSNNLKNQVNTLKSELAKITTLAVAEHEVEFCLAPQTNTKKLQQQERQELHHLRDRFTHSQHSNCEERVKLVEQRTKELTSKAAALEDQIHKLKEEKNETDSKFKQLADSLRKMSIKEALLEVNIPDCSDLEKETQLLKDIDWVKGVLEESKDHYMQPERQINSLKRSPDERDKNPPNKQLKSQSVLGLHRAQRENVLSKQHSGCEEKVQVVEERNNKCTSNASDLQHQLKQLEEEKNETEANLRQLADSLEKLLTSETSLEANTHYHNDLEEETQFLRDSGEVKHILEESKDHYEQPEKRMSSLKSNPGENHKYTTIKQLREAVERLKKKKAYDVQDQIFKMAKENNDTKAKLFQQADSIRMLSMNKASLRVNTHHHNTLEEKTTQLLKLIYRTKKILENDNHCVQSERQTACLKSSLEERDKNTTITELKDGVEGFKKKKPADLQDQIYKMDNEKNTRQHANSLKMLPMSNTFLAVNTNNHSDLQERTTQLLKLISRTKRMLDNKNHYVQPERQIIMAKNTTIKQLKDTVERLKKERLGLSLTALEKEELKMKANKIAEEWNSPTMDLSRHSQAEGGFRRMKEKVEDLAEKKVEKAVSFCSQLENVNWEIKKQLTSPKRSRCCSVQLERSKMQPCEDLFPNHLRADNLVQVNLQFQTANQKAGDQIKVTTSKPHELEQNIQRLERELARACSMQYDSLERTTTKQS
ncbi:ankyrin repeat domain-containing protein 26-like [Solea solea]|uniref:ankyrin repeat domain-containing protein 26-like n=1 Tax=Solea solea TaxID=90069 RepID=UPI00272C9C8F|nr:ankyrin repeat domain-containing protein 26-like [Solea solea]